MPHQVGARVGVRTCDPFSKKGHTSGNSARLAGERCETRRAVCLSYKSHHVLEGARRAREGFEGARRARECSACSPVHTSFHTTFSPPLPRPLPSAPCAIEVLDDSTQLPLHTTFTHLCHALCRQHPAQSKSYTIPRNSAPGTPGTVGHLK